MDFCDEVIKDHRPCLITFHYAPLPKVMWFVLRERGGGPLPAAMAASA